MSMHQNPHLILASASPRRRELLSLLPIQFITMPLDTPEPFNDDPPEDQALRLAKAKLEEFRIRRSNYCNYPVLCADTCVDLDGEIIGKPTSEAEAETMLRRLSGQTHRVISALALHLPGGGSRYEREVSEVQFADLNEREISWYISSGEWQGVAGGYRIQEKGGALIEGIKGSYHNVMGLPLRRLYGMLQSTVPELLSM